MKIIIIYISQEINIIIFRKIFESKKCIIVTTQGNLCVEVALKYIFNKIFFFMVSIHLERSIAIFCIYTSIFNIKYCNRNTSISS